MINCIVWIGDQRFRSSDLIDFLELGNIKCGSVVKVYGLIEYYGGEIQINVEKFSIIQKSVDEMGFYLQTLDLQKNLFHDPMLLPEPSQKLREVYEICKEDLDWNLRSDSK